MTQRTAEEQAAIDARVAKASATKEQNTRTKVIAEELARARARNCRCGITPETTRQELRALGAGCTAGQWVCPTLDGIRRRLS